MSKKTITKIVVSLVLAAVSLAVAEGWVPSDLMEQVCGE